MFECPQHYDTRNYMHPVDDVSIEVCQESELVKPRNKYPCDEDFFDLCVSIMADNNLSVPDNSDEAVILYDELRPILRQTLM